jgi:type IV pilus assembly protein PilF
VWLFAVLACALLLSACANKPSQPTQNESPALLNAQLGLNYMRQGNYDVAMEKLKRALEQDPNLPEAHHYIAELYKTLRNNDLAEQHYRRALKLSPNDGALQNNYAVFLCDVGRYAEADERFVKAARTSDYQRPEEAYQNAATCALRIPDRKRAMAYLRSALDINPLLPGALYQMTQLSVDNGDYLQARAFLQRFEAIARHTSLSLWWGVAIERELGNPDAAADYARQLRQEFPRSEEAAKLRELK